MPKDKYSQIVEALRLEVTAAEPGSRFISENQLAVRFEVSRPTAARALRELVAAGLVERRVGSGSFVRRPPEALGPSIGVILAGLGATEVWDPLSRHLAQACAARGLTMVVDPQSHPRDEVEAASELVDHLIERGVDGVLFAPLELVEGREDHNREICARLSAAGIPVVLLDRDLAEFPGRSEFDLVGIDNARAGALVGAHLAERGLSPAVFVSYPGFPGTTDLRSAGCRWGLARAGFQVRTDWHVTGDPSDAAWVSAVLEEHQPRVAVCSNDRTAALLLQTLSRLGRSVPDEIAVTGFDDVVYSELLPVALTTLAQPFAQIAQAAVVRLQARIAEPDLDPVEVLLAPRLVVRASTQT